MMEDKKIAKAFLSAITGEEVQELEFAAQEHTIRRPAEKQKKDEEVTEEKLFLTVCRFDFSAKISLPGGGFKTVMIELQKAKLSSDIMRFRRYLGLHYQNQSNTYGSDGEKARQIYCIFLLGYDIGILECPVIRVDYSPVDVSTGNALHVSNEFIRSLHHRSWIIQIDQLKRRRRNDVEKLLSIFDQENRTQNHHILTVNEKDFPETYRPIIRRLRMAYESEDVRIEMEMEDDFMKELQDRERLIAKHEETIEEKNKAIEEKDKTIEEKDKAIEEKDKAIEKKDKTIEEKDKAIEEKDKLIEDLKKQLTKNKNP
jgi:hypothetical protein